MHLRPNYSVARPFKMLAYAFMYSPLFHRFALYLPLAGLSLNLICIFKKDTYIIPKFQAIAETALTNSSLTRSAFWLNISIPLPYLPRYVRIQGIRSPVLLRRLVYSHFNNLSVGAGMPPPRSPAKKHAGAAVAPTAKLL